MTRRIWLSFSGLLMLGLCQPVLAHPVHDFHPGFGAGFMHVALGLDHVLVALAVGLWAAQRHIDLFRLPGSFLAFIAIGALAAGTGLVIPMVETGIAASVLLAGLLVTGAVRCHPLFGMALVGIFAILHGNVHGAGLAPMSSVWPYTLGWLAATAAFLAAGSAAGAAIIRLGWRAGLRLAGAAIAGVGTSLVLA